ncbi:MAG TPA: FAD-dependent monooxygenase [Eoetvoesiella sp.]|uniref:FAD-dependent oxidoreductase n=1 Tax=Eoetvoesiella sp. TaxID=1966355 RepID=UPI002CA77A98|nr:FAD-dependent monooxygenase [Eoetvoesiella sp.]HWK60358.1 FAD-dependent monooxygenase [Eoetvoesiella sp.]
MSKEVPVIIAGAGPVGMVAAADLVRRGIPVTVCEKMNSLSLESRASTFHPPTLDMLDDLGFAEPLMAQGLVAPTVQYSSTADGELGTFNFSAISDLTRHPYRVQSEQFKLTRIILDRLKDNPLFTIRFGAPIVSISQDTEGVDIGLQADGGTQRHRCRWLIGADGANSIVRRAQDIEFDGFTWPERFLVITTSFDFASARPGVSSVSYVADPVRWHFLLRIVGAWRVMMPVATEKSDEEATSDAYIQESMRRVLPPGADFDVQHVTLYRVHQRVAKSFRLGRTFLAGDAAHINNPLGGMGMNGGIHDALNLSKRLGRVILGEAGEAALDSYDLQRRTVTLEAIQGDTIRNKRNLEARDENDRRQFRDQIREAAADPEKGRALLRRIAMFDSLERAASLEPEKV